MEYTKTSILGEGAYGIVYLCEKKSNKVKYAIKRNILEAEMDFLGSIKELRMLKHLNGHPHIVDLVNISIGKPFKERIKYPGSNRKEDALWFIFENAVCDGDKIKCREPLSIVKKSLFQILIGIEYLHREDIIHQDIKPCNFLCFGSGDQLTLKLCDFGLAVDYNRQQAYACQAMTSWYRPPEVILNRRDYGKNADIWSYGCVLFELISGKALMSGVEDSNSEELIYQLCNRLRKPISKEEWSKLTEKPYPIVIHAERTWEDYLGIKPSEFDKVGGGTFEQFTDLLERTLQVDPEKRAEAKELLCHPFFSSYTEEFERTINFPSRKSPRIVIYNCYERQYAARIIFSIFNYMNSMEGIHVSWYKHIILFQSISLFDRWLEYWIPKQKPFDSEASETQIKLWLYTCIYLALKYFISMEIPIKFSQMVDDCNRAVKIYCQIDSKAFNAAEISAVASFEKKLIFDVLDSQIYQATIYDVAEKLEANQVSRLIRLYGNWLTSSYDTAVEMYELCRVLI